MWKHVGRYGHVTESNARVIFQSDPSIRLPFPADLIRLVAFQIRQSKCVPELNTHNYRACKPRFH